MSIFFSCFRSLGIFVGRPYFYSTSSIFVHFVWFVTRPTRLCVSLCLFQWKQVVDKPVISFTKHFFFIQSIEVETIGILYRHQHRHRTSRTDRWFLWRTMSTVSEQQSITGLNVHCRIEWRPLFFFHFGWIDDEHWTSLVAHVSHMRADQRFENVPKM